ncbi:MAG TPA: hypothetical protein VFC29_22920 [Candidatus Limnocylindrales bacterium]|jgi:hypothetical protein|nr:hypothetical protein [Candidatus Limnocylindrales bacterium]
MREQLETRLQELRNEFQTGHAKLQESERQQLVLRETLLRISGAIQVLEELLEKKSEAGPQEVPMPVPARVAGD